MSTPQRTEIPPVEEFFLNAPEPTNFWQVVGVLQNDTEVVQFKSGRVIKGSLLVQRNGANGADWVNLDDFEEDWYGGTRKSALERAKKGAVVIASGEYRKDSRTVDGQRRYYDKMRVRHVRVLDSNPFTDAQRAAIDAALDA